MCAYNVLIVRLLVGLGAESYKAVVVDECPQWVARRDERVYAQIELEAVEEKRIGNVLLHDVVVLRMNFVHIFVKLDAMTHGAICWLHNIGLLLVKLLLHLVGVRDETGMLVRHYPRLGHKVKVLWH